MKCDKCLNDFPEPELQLSHDIPKYMGGTDKDGRHWLCKECHLSYENEVLKAAIMYLIQMGDEDEKQLCKAAARMVRAYFFKGRKEDDIQRNTL